MQVICESLSFTLKKKTGLSPLWLHKKISPSRKKQKQKTHMD
jgi:hypothetical protein